MPRISLEELMASMERNEPGWIDTLQEAVDRLRLMEKLVEIRRVNYHRPLVAKEMGWTEDELIAFEGAADFYVSDLQRYAAVIGAKIEFTVTPIAETGGEP